MNYLTEILEFYRYLALNPMPALLQAYWHLLLHANNKSALPDESGIWRWPVAFKVPNTVVMARLGLDDRRKVMRHRNKLIGAGLVSYEKDTGQRAGWYRLVPFDRGIDQGWVRLTGQNERTLVWTQKAPEVGPKAGPFINMLNPKPPSYHDMIPGAPKAPTPEAAMEEMKRNVNAVFGKALFEV